MTNGIGQLTVHGIQLGIRDIHENLALGNDHNVQAYNVEAQMPEAAIRVVCPWSLMNVGIRYCPYSGGGGVY